MDSLLQIKNVAADWVARRHSIEWTQVDESTFHEWLNASISHRVEYLSHEKTWQDANRLQVFGAGSQLESSGPIAEWRRSPYFKYVRGNISDRLRSLPSAVSENDTSAAAPPTGKATIQSRHRHFAIASCFLLGCIAVYLAWDHSREPYYSTSIGITTAVPLSDGSKITLNSNSAVRVGLTERQRVVELKQGEAYFEVASDPNRPFIVHAAGQQIVVLGTKFSVRRDGDEIRVIVTEGKVRAGDVFLAAGSIARAHNSQIFVQQKSLPKVEDLLSWREGYLMFDEISLGEAVAEFNRYNTRKFLIKDPAIANISVTGHFRSTNVESFARLLEEGFRVSIEREGDTIILGSAKLLSER